MTGDVFSISDAKAKFDPSTVEVASYLLMVGVGVVFFLNQPLYVETSEHPLIALGRGGLALMVYTILMTLTLFVVVRVRMEVSAA